MFWGITPSLDLLNEYNSTKGDNLEELNILLVGSSDCRHVLKTLARKYRHKKVKLNFFLMDACVENIARQLLLLMVALQPQQSLGLDQKTKIFMELYGNTLVRPSVAKFLNSAASSLIEMVTNCECLREIMGCVALDIKYKERDYLENLLKFWCTNDEFNIIDSWDRRLRKFLGIRYDSMVGAFDWDLHMRFHSVGGKQVCNQEYRNFRTNGVAFSWLESEVSKPNRSLVCAIFPNGAKFGHYGYLGDMQTGPFVSFGLDCEDNAFLQSNHGQNTYRATDVTERNLKQIFFEIQHQKEYDHFATTDMKLGPVVMKQEKLVVDIKGVDVIPKPIRKCIELEDTIRFISISTWDQMQYKESFHDFFDIIYFGKTDLKYIDKSIVEKVTKNGSLMVIENQLFVLSNRKKELEEYAKQIDGKIEGMNVDKLEFDPQVHSYAKFIIKHI